MSAVTVFGHGRSGQRSSAPPHLRPTILEGGAHGIGLDRYGNVYVPSELFIEPDDRSSRPSDRTRIGIQVYRSGADSVSQPIRTLVGQDTQLGQPWDVDFDSRGDMYVVDRSNSTSYEVRGQISIFDAEARGNAAPRRVIQGRHTGLQYPIRMALGAGDTLFVLNVPSQTLFCGFSHSGTVTVYPPYASGDVAPVRTLTVVPVSLSSSDSISTPEGLAVDRGGAIYVSTDGPIGVLVYAPGGAQRAMRSLSGCFDGRDISGEVEAVEVGTSTAASSELSRVSEAFPSCPSRRRSRPSSSSLPAGVPASEAVAMRIAGAPEPRSGACSPYPNGSASETSCVSPAGRRGALPVRLRSAASRWRRARVVASGRRAPRLQPWTGGAREAVERDHGDGASGQRRTRREARRAQRAVRAAVRGQEDERVEGRPRGLGRPHGRVGTRELDERGGSARVVVRSSGSAVVVTMSNDHDRLVERARHDGREVLELDAADPGHVLLPAVFPDGQAVEGELLAEPLGGGRGAGRAGYAARVQARELGRQRGRSGRVERGRERRRGQRARRFSVRTRSSSGATRTTETLRTRRMSTGRSTEPRRGLRVAVPRRAGSIRGAIVRPGRRSRPGRRHPSSLRCRIPRQFSSSTTRTPSSRC